MKVEINLRGNGACPICKKTGKCRVQDLILKSMAAVMKKDELMEMVIYTCPGFVEQTSPEKT